MMLNDDYRRVAVTTELERENSSQAAPRAIVHALWYGGANPNKPLEGREWRTDVTMCGRIEALDVKHLPKTRIVSCAHCNAALKKERQARSKEGTARFHERRQVEAAMEQAGYERHGDTVMVPNAEIDRILVDTLQMRASALRAEGFEGIAADLEIAAGRRAEHAHTPDTGVVTDRRHVALSYLGPERRLRPRHVHPTPDNEL